MITFPPLPHEFISAHLARLCAVNAFQCARELFLDIKAAIQQDGQLDPLLQVAKLSSMTKQNYERRHTLLGLSGFRSAISPRKVRAIYGALNTSGKASILTTVPCKFCSECRRTNIDHYGCTYWHRSHQVAGIYICPIHQSPLTLCGPDAIGRYPNPVQIDGIQPSDRLVYACTENPVLKRYGHACEVLLRDSSSRSPYRKITLGLAELQAKHDLPIDGLGQSPHVPQYVEEQLPAEWLTQHFMSTHAGYRLYYKDTPSWSNWRRWATWHLDLRLLSLCALASSEAELSLLLIDDTRAT